MPHVFVMTSGLYLTPTIRIMRKLGHGGMSTVWVAENVTLGVEVAVKIMSPGYADDEHMRERFRREAQRAARIKSHHVTRVFDYGITADGQPFIVMELLEGETLRERMDRSRMSLADVAWLVVQTAKGLAAAHKLGLIHRDIKPDNLFVTNEGGQVFMKILDFGIARDLDSVTFTTTGKVMGTPLYMSPEQFDAVDMDLRADIWSLGVVTYEALTGRPPFLGNTIPSIYMAIRSGEFLPPSTLRPELSKAVDRWMARALSRTPSERFPSAMQMADELWRALGMPPLSLPPSSGSRFAMTETVVDVRPELPLPRLDFEPAESTQRWLLRQDAIGGEEVSSPLSPSQDARLSVVEDRARGVLSLSVRDTWPRAAAFDETGQALFVTFATGEVLGLDLAARRPRFWSRLDARPICPAVGAGWLVIGCKDGMIRSLDVNHGAHGKTLVWEKQAIQSLAMDPASQTICACRGNGEASVWSFASGLRIPNALSPSDRIRALAFEKTRGLWAGARDYAVHLWDASLRPLLVLRGASSSIRSIAFASDGSLLAAGAGDGTIWIWELAGFSLYRVLSGHSKRIGPIALLPNRKGLVSTSSDRTVRIWNIETGATELVIDGRAGEVEAVTSTPDGSVIATVSADRYVRLYAWPLDRSLGRLPTG